MPKNNKTDKEIMWERLKHVPVFPGPHTFSFDYDVNSMYPGQITRTEWKEGDDVTIKVLKNR